MFLLRLDLYCVGPWYCEDFGNIFLPNIGEGETNVLRSERRAPDNLPYGKSGLIIALCSWKRIDEGLRLQL